MQWQGSSRSFSRLRRKTDINRLGYVMSTKVRIIRPTDPDFKKLLELGQLVSGADLNTEMHEWNVGDRPGPDDEVVQSKSRK